MKKITFLVAALCATMVMNAETVTDELTSALFKATGTSYTAFSDVTLANSGAVLAGNSAKSNSDAIQLRSKNSTAGIVTTASSCKLTKVVVVWDAETSSTGDRQLDVYGKSTAYTAASDLYNNDTKGELLGSIICGTSTELVIPEASQVEYIGLRSKDGAMYITSISLVWEKSEGGEPTAIENVEMPAIYANNGTIYGAEGARIFTISGMDVTEQNGSLNGIYVVTFNGKAQKIAVK